MRKLIEGMDVKLCDIVGFSDNRGVVYDISVVVLLGEVFKNFVFICVVIVLILEVDILDFRFIKVLDLF